MADSSESRSVARATKPVSEALLNEKVYTPPEPATFHAILLLFQRTEKGCSWKL